MSVLKFGPFSEHIIDAIIINTKRLPRYAKLSHGLSIPASVGLILFEVFILPLAWYYDLRETSWRQYQLDILSDDFISMESIPHFKKKATDIPNGDFSLKKVRTWRQNIHHYQRSNQWHQAYEELQVLRGELLKEKAAYPLLYHFLESVHRGNALTIMALERFVAKEVEKKFLRYRTWFLFWQMVGFEGALLLDAMAWPLRRRGLLIFEQDIPSIPVPKL